MDDEQKWRPATIEDVEKIVAKDLSACDDEQVKAFQAYAVEPRYAPIVRYGEEGQVVVVAQRENEVIYWEDYEEGFNRSQISDKGEILEHGCNQDELGLALNAWIDGRDPP